MFGDDFYVWAKKWSFSSSSCKRALSLRVKKKIRPVLSRERATEGWREGGRAGGRGRTEKTRICMMSAAGEAWGRPAARCWMVMTKWRPTLSSAWHFLPIAWSGGDAANQSCRLPLCERHLLPAIGLAVQRLLLWISVCVCERRNSWHWQGHIILCYIAVGKKTNLSVNWNQDVTWFY